MGLVQFRLSIQPLSVQDKQVVTSFLGMNVVTHVISTMLFASAHRENPARNAKPAHRGKDSLGTSPQEP